MRDVALFLHVAGAFVLAGGVACAGVAFEAARRRQTPQEIALLLGLTRLAAGLIGAGTVVVLACGLWLVHLDHLSVHTHWVAAALVLLTAMVMLGALGGRRPKQARRLAADLARRGEPATPELRRLLDDRPSLAANYLAAACMLAILWLMVTKPTL
jgi:uncharacterized membrane protein